MSSYTRAHEHVQTNAHTHNTHKCTITIIKISHRNKTETRTCPPENAVLTERVFRASFAKLMHRELTQICQDTTHTEKLPLKSHTDIASDTKRAENYVLMGWMVACIQEKKDVARRKERKRE